MKKTQKFLALLLVAAMTTLAACEKENNTNNNGTAPQPEPEPVGISLAGTSWECDINTEFSQQGVLMLVDAQMIMDLNDERNGEMFVDLVVEVPAAPAYNQSQNVTEPLTYFFDGTTLTLTSTGDDAVEGDEGVLTYKASDTTFNMYIGSEPQAAAIYGTDTLVFRLMRGTINF